MSASKAEIRRESLARRGAVPLAERDAFAARIATLGPRLVHDFAPGNAGLVVSLYAPINSEPDVMPLAHALHAAGVPLALPVDWTTGTPLVFRRWKPGDRMAPGPLNILEPLPEAPEVDPDVLFVPLAAFDRRGHRVGYGAGHYDRSIAKLRALKPVKTIGVAYSVQENLFLPAEPHDEPLDMILTDRHTLICGD